MSKSEETPAEITNIEVYKEYEKIKDEIANYPKRYFKASDGQTYDLTASKPIIIKKARNKIPAKELEEMLAINNKLRSLIGKTVALKKKFYTLPGQSYNKSEDLLMLRNTEILELFGRWYNSDEVHRVITKDWKQPQISISAVKQFAAKNREKIAQLRVMYEENDDEIQLSSKKFRLNQLNYLLSDRRQIYDRTHKIEDSKEIREIIKQAKTELEGDAIRVDINGQIDVNLSISIEEQMRVFNRQLISQIVLSRVAAKLNINPLFLLNSLSNSIYAKFNGYQRNDSMFEEQPEYPSKLVYDFNKIEEAQVYIEANQTREMALPEIKTDLTKSLSFKERVLAEIAMKKRQISDNDNNIKNCNYDR